MNVSSFNSGGRYATQFVLAAVLFFAVDAMAQTTNILSDAEIQGRKLAQQLRDAPPAESITNSAVLIIRDAERHSEKIPVRFQVALMAGEPSGWVANYETTDTNFIRLTISHAANQPNQYRLQKNGGMADLRGGTEIPFAGSDFWLCDFGLEFLFWPDQKVLKKEFHDNCASIVLESRNPQPSASGYARVVSRIEEESGGIMEAQTYDLAGRQLKDFRVKDLKKVNGHWQVETVIMENRQTRSRTQLEFDLKK